MDDEKICRICRCPEEEDNKLFYPCSCSGSMKYVHNDCLLQWLEHASAREEKCELCGEKFTFKIYYADGAPEKLSYIEMGFLAVKKCMSLIPYAGRILLAAFCWLIITPLAAAELLKRSSMNGIRASNDWSFFYIDLNFKQWKLGIAVSVIDIFIFLFFFLSVIDFVQTARDEREVMERAEVNALAEIQQAANVNGNNPDVANDHDNNQQQIGNIDPNARAADNVDEHHGNDNNNDQQGHDGDDNNGANNADDDDDEEEDDEEEDDNDEEEEEEDDGNRQDAAGVGVADLPLMEMVGLRGPIKSLFLNVMLLIFFHFLNLTSGVFFPGALGGFVLSQLDRGMNYFFDFHILSEPHVTSSFILRRPVEEEAINFQSDGTTTPAINKLMLPEYPRLIELLCVFIGYAIIVLSIVCIKVSTFGFADPTSSRDIDGSKKIVLVISDLAKVTSLLVIKMAIFPICLGYLLEVASRPLFKTSFDRYEFANEYPLLAIGVLWVAGISNMLVFTLSILHLREILHPDVLDGIIRPHDPNADMLKTLFREPVTKHIKRLCLSTLIYSTLVFFVVYLPITAADSTGKLLPIPLNLNYYAVEIQLPMELSIIHMFTLFFLEKNRKTILRFQRYFIVKMCLVLGLTFYLLPLPKRIEGQDENKEEKEEDFEDILLHRWPPENIRESLREQEGRRPENAKHWLDPGPVIPLALLRERVYPSFYPIRVLILDTVIWIACVCSSIVALATPAVIGVLVSKLLDVSIISNHDIHVYGIGCLSLWIMVSISNQANINGIDDLRAKLNYLLVAFETSSASMKWVLFQLFVMIPIEIGVILETCLFLNDDHLDPKISLTVASIKAADTCSSSLASDNSTISVQEIFIKHLSLTLGGIHYFRNWCLGTFIGLVIWKFLGRRVLIRPAILFQLFLQNPLGQFRLFQNQSWISLIANGLGLCLFLPMIVAVTTEILLKLNGIFWLGPFTYFQVLRSSFLLGVFTALFTKFLLPRLSTLHDTLRDDKYMIGRQLVNIGSSTI